MCWMTCHTVLAPGSEKIVNYHLTGHDLLAIRIGNHEVFSRIGVIKIQKHFFPLVSGPVHIRGALEPTGASHRTVGNLKSHVNDSVCGTVHYNASTVPGMSGSPCRGPSTGPIRGSRSPPWNVGLRRRNAQCSRRVPRSPTTAKGLW